MSSNDVTRAQASARARASASRPTACSRPKLRNSLSQKSTVYPRFKVVEQQFDHHTRVGEARRAVHDVRVDMNDREYDKMRSTPRSFCARLQPPAQANNMPAKQTFSSARAAVHRVAGRDQTSDVAPEFVEHVKLGRDEFVAGIGLSSVRPVRLLKRPRNGVPIDALFLRTIAFNA